MKKRLPISGLWLICLFAALYPSGPVRSQIQVPHYQGYVTDLAGVIGAAQEQRITSIITALNRNTKAEIAVLTVDTTGDESIFDFAMAVAEQWKPGDAELENGVVFVVSIKDRDMYILTGYGVEGVLPDGKVGGIQDQYVLPFFKQNNYGNGILMGVLAMAAAIDPERAGQYEQIAGSSMSQRAYSRPGKNMRLGTGRIIFTILFIPFFIYMAIRHPRLLLLMMIFSSGRRGGYGGGGGFGGGFGGFGGGGFGGGGSGRSW